jgi:hypothetical protein
MTVNREALQGRWVHSHEEDTDDRLVFRPAAHKFPPSRGRQAFELRPDGAFVERASGPDDRPKETKGRWSLDEGSVSNVLSLHFVRSLAARDGRARGLDGASRLSGS